MCPYQGTAKNLDQFFRMVKQVLRGPQGRRPLKINVDLALAVSDLSPLNPHL